MMWNLPQKLFLGHLNDLALLKINEKTRIRNLPILEINQSFWEKVVAMGFHMEKTVSSEIKLTSAACFSLNWGWVY